MSFELLKQHPFLVSLCLFFPVPLTSVKLPADFPPPTNNKTIRYVGANSNVARFSFAVPMQGCGTSSDAEGGSNVASNVIVIQNDAVVQEIWDSAQKLSCRWTDRVTKTVSVRPLTIDMLEATEAKFANADDDVVDVWMDLQQGRWPASGPIESAVRIGEQLSLIVGLNDPSGQMDLQVRDCYAHSMPELANPAAFRVQLTDAQGCVMKTKLLGPFEHDRSSAGPYAGSTVKWSPVSAFAFPDNMQVFTSCNVEVCKGGCEPNPCQPAGSQLFPEPAASTRAPPKPTSPSASLIFSTEPPRTAAPTLPPTTAAVVTVRITTPTTTRTVPQVTLPSLDYLPPYPAEKTAPPKTAAPKSLPETTTPKFTLPPNITPPTTTLEPPPPPPKAVTTAPYVCLPGSEDPRCPTLPPPTTAAAREFICSPGSNDPRCPAPTTQPTPVVTDCYQGSDNPDCLDRNPKGGPILCLPGSRDPECVVPGGSNESPVTATTVLTTRPTARTSKPDLEVPASGSKDGAPDSWKGDPASHAFHMFHFQRGDGRRGSRRIPLAKKPRRSVDNLVDDGRTEFAQVRLTRSVKVLPALAVEPVSSSVEFFRQSDPSLADLNGSDEDAEETFCVTSFSLAACAVLVVTSMMGLIVIVVFLAVKYNTARKQLEKMASRR